MFSSSDISPSDMFVDLRTGEVQVFNLEPSYCIDKSLIHFAPVASIPFRFLYP